MNFANLDPRLIEIGVPALTIGIALGALFAWLLYRRRQNRFNQDLALLESQIASQEAMRQEREIAFEAATSRLAHSFSELSSQSLKSNSESFLRLAEQNLSTQQEKSKRELSEREKAVEGLVKPIREALQASQQQAAEAVTKLQALQQSHGALTRATGATSDA